MGVMPCDRADCDNIMCRHLVLEGTRDGSRYLCHECLHELRLFRETWPDDTCPADVERLIRGFLGTPVGTFAGRLKPDPEAVEAEFRRLTGL